MKVLMAVVVAVTLGALAASCYWVPSYKIIWRKQPRTPTEYAWRPINRTSNWWHWQRPNTTRMANSSIEIDWTVLFATQGGIVLAGGIALMALLRGQRRRRATMSA